MNDEYIMPPWRVGGDGFMGGLPDRSKIGAVTGLNIVSDGGSGGWSITTFIAHLSAGGDVEKRLARAYLLAAAPESLGVCERLVAGDDMDMLVVAARHAIEKATPPPPTAGVPDVPEP